MQTTTTGSAKAAVSSATLDAILTAQLSVAWAGEAGESPRLGWWKTDLVSEFGGEDLFKRLLPHTWRWAVLEGAREAARRRDTELRAQDSDPDRLLTLFRLGFELDERVDERLRDHKRHGVPPVDALPGLKDVMTTWSREAFASWVSGHGATETTKMPTGRKIAGEPPLSVELTVNKLVGALHPLIDAYPLPHFRKPG